MLPAIVLDLWVRQACLLCIWHLNRKDVEVFHFEALISALWPFTLHLTQKTDRTPGFLSHLKKSIHGELKNNNIHGLHVV